MIRSVVVDQSKSHNHTCFFYEDKQARMDLVIEYFEQGIADNELCVFVTSDTPKQVMDYFTNVDSQLTNAISTGALRVFEMNSTYLTQGKFVVNYMLNNVRGFIEDAKSLGYKGLRTAGEMSWINHFPSESDNAMAYERVVNTLNEPTPSFVGLCLYPAHEIDDQTTQVVLDTHPSIVYKNNFSANPFYVAA